MHVESVPSEYTCFLNRAVFKFDIISTILSGISCKQTCVPVLWLYSFTERERENRQRDRQTETQRDREREEKTDMTRTVF